jgi:hypothetical protein
MNHALKRLLEQLHQLREAIASVSLSHDEGCACDTCKAAHGNEEAFGRLVSSMGGDGR